jgi:methyltransferase
VTAFYGILLLVALQRLGELVVNAANTKRLLARGGCEYGRGHYPVMVVLHTAWLVSLLLVVPGDTPPDWWLIGVFGLCQLGRAWVMVSLGEYWTTRIIRVPGAPIIRSGPYRFMRHPNYAVVVIELAVLPLAFGAWQHALVFTLLNAALLYVRITAENRALEETQ